jgi:putative NADPH-quinone reductase
LGGPTEVNGDIRDTVMRLSIVLAHPSEGSLSHAIARKVVERAEANGHDALFHDLYRERFDPLLGDGEFSRDAPLPEAIARHCAEIAEADGIVVVHPNWWGMPPAILKGWVDRVLRPGVAYEFVEGEGGEGVPNGLLRAKAAVVFNTSNTETEREKNVFGDPLETIWRNCVFGLCGVANFHRRTFNVVITSSEDQRKRWLDETGAIIDEVFPKAPITPA